MTIKGYTNVSAAAELLGISQQRVRELVRAGTLKGEKVGRSWLITEESCKNHVSKSAPASTVCHDRSNIIGKTGRPCALSFFTGAMGLDLGMEQEGIEFLLASEVDAPTRSTIAANKPQMALIGDLSNYSAQEIRTIAGLSVNEEVDIVVGGPPCQAFSTAGKRGSFEDLRGNIFIKFVELSLELSPRYIVIENVRGLLSAPLKHRPHAQRGNDDTPLATEELKGGALLFILRLIESSGYKVSFNLYNSANYGSFQKRERVIIIANRTGPEVPFLFPTHSEDGKFGLRPWRTLREAIGGLRTEDMHHVEFPARRAKYYQLLREGQNWRNLPVDMQKEALGASYKSGGGKTGFLRRLAWDKPSPTLVTHPAMPATDLCHPEEIRPLSIEEYKRIQEFPDEWKLQGSMLAQYKQIGNAVPLSLGRAIARTIKSHMLGEETKQIKGFPYSRYKASDHLSWYETVLPARMSKSRSQMNLTSVS